MESRPVLLVLFVIRLIWATSFDLDYGGVPLWINRFLGEPSVLSLRGRGDSSWYRAVNSESCPLECDCPIQWPSALYCDQRGLRILPVGLPPRTQYLFLQGNSMSGLPANAFTNTTRLRWLFLDRNQLLSGQVPAMVWSNLSHLENLFMNYNNLTEVPSGLPSGLKQLRLAYNQIGKIAPGSFKNLQNLTILLLQGNRLKTIGRADFTGLHSINLLDLSHNRLDLFPSHLPPSVQQLYLSNNSLIGLFEDSLQGFHSLGHLRLSHNQLRSPNMAPGAFNVSTMVELDLSYNQLTSIPVVPTTLLYLYLEANQIEEFNVTSLCRTVGPVDYSNMRILRLDGNKLASHELPPDWVMCLRVLHNLYI
ncbi:lumican [Megalops cyprinoides]|uniref:lumican n=1 Tax=Megalops cyprinoides TaxID=118141 RepID=UPI00186449D6|nr:lumican [Megalops cyprinoides]